MSSQPDIARHITLLGAAGAPLSRTRGLLPEDRG